MAFVLGKDGKERAIQASVGDSPADLGTVYLGVLDALPAGYDGLDAATLLANEANVVNFYTPSDRRALSFGAVASSSTGASVNNDASVSWTNNSGASFVAEGVFITDASSGTGGKILWVGAPDVPANFNDGEDMTVLVGDMKLEID